LTGYIWRDVKNPERAQELLDEALAAERRATEERIRPRVLQLCDSPGIRAAFDEEAAR
jgi:hypothetical protein